MRHLFEFNIQRHPALNMQPPPPPPPPVSQRTELAIHVNLFRERFVNLAGMCVASVKAMRKAVDLAELKEERDDAKNKKPSIYEVQCARIQHACIATKIDFPVDKPILVQLARLKGALRQTGNIPMADRDAVDDLAYETDAYVSVAYREIHGHLVAVSKVVREALETWKSSFTVANIFSSHTSFDRRAAFEQTRIRRNCPLLSCLHDLVAQTNASVLSELMPLARMAQLTGTLATMAELGDLSTAREETKAEWEEWMEDGATIVEHRVISDIMDTAVKHSAADNSAMRIGITAADVVRAAAFWATLLTGRQISSEACGPAKIQITPEEFKAAADGVVRVLDNRLENLFNAAKQRSRLAAAIAEGLNAEEAKLQEQASADASADRASQIRTVDRSERIRTYNFPENRIADHRINFKAHNLDQVLDGELDPLLDALAASDKQSRLQQA